MQRDFLKEKKSKVKEKLRLIANIFDSGCYWQRMNDFSTSQIFENKEEAVNARNNNQLVFY